MKIAKGEKHRICQSFFSRSKISISSPEALNWYFSSFPTTTITYSRKLCAQDRKKHKKTFHQGQQKGFNLCEHKSPSKPKDVYRSYQESPTSIYINQNFKEKFDKIFREWAKLFRPSLGRRPASLTPSKGAVLFNQWIRTKKCIEMHWMTDEFSKCDPIAAEIAPLILKQLSWAKLNFWTHFGTDVQGNWIESDQQLNLCRLQ